MSGVRAGNLRELADIEDDAAPAGASDPSYSKIKYQGVPCRVEIVSGDETYRGRQLESHLSHVVEMQRLPGIKPDMRLNMTGGNYAGRKLNIVYVRDLTGDGPLQRQQLYCRELAAT